MDKCITFVFSNLTRRKLSPVFYIRNTDKNDNYKNNLKIVNRQICIIINIFALLKYN